MLSKIILLVLEQDAFSMICFRVLLGICRALLIKAKAKCSGENPWEFFRPKKGRAKPDSVHLSSDQNPGYLLFWGGDYTTYHGNPQPSFLEVISPTKGSTPSFFMGFWGPRVPGSIGYNLIKHLIRIQQKIPKTSGKSCDKSCDPGRTLWVLRVAALQGLAASSLGDKTGQPSSVRSRL